MRTLLPASSLLALSFIFSCCVLSCAADGAEELQQYTAPIINGEACAANKLPETAALIVEAMGETGNGPVSVRLLMCTATLIAPDVALTAAHCVDEDMLGELGLSNLSFYLTFQADLTAFTQFEGSLPPLPADAHLARSVVKHEDFDINQLDESDGLSDQFDIGLVFLDQPVTGIKPAIVITPEEAVNLAVGDEVQIAGWGRRTAEESNQIGSKHCATANIFEIGDSEMRIGNESSTARKCHGDSGGPTYVNLITDTRRKSRVIGATSRAYDSSDCQRGGVDTMPSAHYEWMDAQMSGKCGSGDRAWCEVAGVVLPEYYEVVEPAEVEPEEKDSDGGGCGCRVTSSDKGTSAAGLLLGLAMLGLMRRRRPVRA